MTEGRPALATRLAELESTLDVSGALKRRGIVTAVGDGIAQVVGLENVGYQELVAFDSGAIGMANDLLGARTSVVLLTKAEHVRAGEGLVPLGRLPSIQVSDELLGRILDPQGQPLDGRPAPRGVRSPIFQEAPELIERIAIDRPLVTGVMVADAAIPIGRGQRQLIIGDRNVGKTALALDFVCAQQLGDVACVYVLIGQSTSRELAIKETLSNNTALANTVVIAADASTAPGMQFIAPYAAASVAEFFRDRGQDALIVYDDLTKHADAYRELALLLDRPSGREAFPGDIFHIHAELLERAAPRRPEAGGGSVTAFPIVETFDGEISAYIPTNLISITDGQIYLDSARFERNLRPAVDVGKSVSRIGGIAQPPALREAAGNLRINLSRFESLETFTRVGLDVDPETMRTIHRGRILREALRQDRFSPRTVGEQILILRAISEGWVDEHQPAKARRILLRAAQRFRREAADTIDVLDSGQQQEGWESVLKDCIARIVEAES